AGAFRWRVGALAGYGGVSVGLVLAVVWGSRFYFEDVVPQKYRAYQQLVRMELAIKRADARVVSPERVEPLPQVGAGKRLAAIRERGTLRGGYLSEDPAVAQPD